MLQSGKSGQALNKQLCLTSEFINIVRFVLLELFDLRMSKKQLSVEIWKNGSFPGDR